MLHASASVSGYQRFCHDIWPKNHPPSRKGSPGRCPPTAEESEVSNTWFRWLGKVLDGLVTLMFQRLPEFKTPNRFTQLSWNKDIVTYYMACMWRLLTVDRYTTNSKTLRLEWSCIKASVFAISLAWLKYIPNIPKQCKNCHKTEAGLTPWPIAGHQASASSSRHSTNAERLDSRCQCPHQEVHWS